MNRRFAMFGVFLGCLALSPLSHAVDDNTVDGLACQEFLGAEAGDFNRASVNGITNVAAGNRFVVCPIVRDNVLNTNGTRSVVMRVQSSGGATLTCTLESYGVFGTFGTALESNSGSTTSNTPAFFVLDVDVSSRGGFYALFCDLPPGGSVISYRVNEF